MTLGYCVNGLFMLRARGLAVVYRGATGFCSVGVCLRGYFFRRGVWASMYMSRFEKKDVLAISGLNSGGLLVGLSRSSVRGFRLSFKGVDFGGRSGRGIVVKLVQLTYYETKLSAGNGGIGVRTFLLNSRYYVLIATGPGGQGCELGGSSGNLY